MYTDTALQTVGGAFRARDSIPLQGRALNLDRGGSKGATLGSEIPRFPSSAGRVRDFPHLTRLHNRVGCGARGARLAVRLVQHFARTSETPFSNADGY